jgi:hypothetical protein
MSKLSKFIKSPVLFFKDAIKKPAIKKPAIKKPAIKKPAIKKPAIKIDDRQLLLLTPDYQIEKDRDAFFYMPWLPLHGDKLINQINISDKYRIYPLRLFCFWDQESRAYISNLSRKDPRKYRSMILSHLIKIKKDIKGFIVTFDWHPAMRIIVRSCKELDIPVVLIPHESAFLDREKYYWYESMDVRLPSADLILCWGSLQRDIFLDRGISKDKLLVVGSPKLDIYVGYKPELSKELLYKVYSLSSDIRTIVFALQPMDSQVDEKFARNKQKQALIDVMDFCDKFEFQLIVREPPSKVNVLYQDERRRISGNIRFAVDESLNYITSPEELIYHTDMVVSINSTMLFEAMLLGKKSISVKYFEFSQLWHRAGIPFSTTKKSLHEKLYRYLSNGESLLISEDQKEWSASNFSVGVFDGRSRERIKLLLEEGFASRVHPKNGDFYNFVEFTAISNINILKDSSKFLPYLLNTSKVISPNNDIEASFVDRYVQWGITTTPSKELLRGLLGGYGHRPYIIEDGFIRSIGIGLSKEPGLSITLCGDTAYYDAYNSSNFELTLNSDRIFSKDELDYASKSINLILKHRISKYNNSPFLPIQIGDSNRSKLLIVDQRFGDASISSSMANEESFKRMLIEAIENNPDYDIIVKRHPDAVKGGKQSYFNDAAVEYLKYTSSVHIIDFDIHPHQLIEMVDKVYVVSSGLGMEALLMGKQVYCYGAPFYSNWGVTKDMINIERRNKKRTIEEIFYTSFILYSRYYSPDLERVCSIEECIDYVIKHRGVAYK